MSERKIQLLPSGVAPQPAARDRAAEPRSLSLDAEPAALWRELLSRLDDDAAHQTFIRACTRQGRLTFALESYRTLEKLRPGDPVAARYLAQVAKTMELGAIGLSASRKIDATHSALRRPMRVLLALVIGLGGMLALYAAVQVARAALAP